MKQLIAANSIASSPGSFPLSACGRKSITLGVQTIDFQRLRQGASNQIAEQNHVDA